MNNENLDVLTVFLPATRPQLLHSHLIITFARLLRHRRGNLHFGPRDLLRGVDVSSDEGGRSSQAAARPARLYVDPEVGWILLWLPAVDDLATLGPPGHRVLPYSVLLAPSVLTFRHRVEGVLGVSLTAGRPRTEPARRGQPRVGAGVVASVLVMSSALLAAVERILDGRPVQRVFGVVEGVVIVVSGGDFQAGVCAGLVVTPLTVSVPVVGVVAVLVSPAALAVLHLVVSSRHVGLRAVWAPLEAILHAFYSVRVEADGSWCVIPVTSQCPLVVII